MQHLAVAMVISMFGKVSSHRFQSGAFYLEFKCLKVGVRDDKTESSFAVGCCDFGALYMTCQGSLVLSTKATGRT